MLSKPKWSYLWASYSIQFVILEGSTKSNAFLIVGKSIAFYQIISILS